MSNVQRTKKFLTGYIHLATHRQATVTSDKQAVNQNKQTAKKSFDNSTIYRSFDVQTESLK